MMEFAVSLLVDVTVKTTVLLLLVVAVALGRRRWSAAERHFAWLLGLTASALLPLLALVLPAWRVLPAWPFTTRSIAAPVAVESKAQSGASSSASRATEPARPRTSVPPDIAARPRPNVEALPHSAPAAQSVPQPVTSAKSIDWNGVIIAAWAAGALLVLARAMIAALSLARLERRSRVITSGEWIALLEEGRRTLGLRRPIKLLMTVRRSMPMTWGVREARLLLPEAADLWGRAQRRSVLWHELAHVERSDSAANLVSQIASAVLWFHPLVWVARRQMMVESEHAADDVVLEAGVSAPDYATHLLSVVTSAPGGIAGALAMSGSSRLEHRVQAILAAHTRRRAPRPEVRAAWAASTLAWIAPLAMLSAGTQSSVSSRGGAATGLVRGADGGLWSAATVTFRSRLAESAEPSPSDDVVEATSDEQGRFSVLLAPGRPYTAWAHQRVDDGNVRVSKLVSEVVAGTEIVLDEDGAPRAEPHLALHGLDAWRSRAPFSLRVEGFVIALDADDGCAVPPLPRAPCVIALIDATSRILYEHTIDLGTTEAGDAVAVEVPPPALLTLHLADEQKHSIAGAVVMIAHGPGTPWRALTRSDGSTIDLNVPVDPGTARWPVFLVRSRGRADVAFHWPTLLGEHLDETPPPNTASNVIDLELPAGFDVRGRVMEDDQHALTSATIVVQTSTADCFGRTVGAQALVVRTDAEGRFEVPGRSRESGFRLLAVLEDEALARVSSTRGASVWWEVPIAAGISMPVPEAMELGTIDLAKLPMVAIVVVDAQGNRAPGVLVRLTEPRPAPWYGAILDVTTDACGEAHVLMPPGITVDAWVATDSGAGHTQLVVPSAVATVVGTLEVSTRHSIAGLVVDHGGKPVAAARVTARARPLEDASAPLLIDCRASTNAHGHFELFLPRPNLCCLLGAEITHDGGEVRTEDEDEQEVTVRDDAVADLRLVLPFTQVALDEGVIADATLRVRVVAKETGAPLANTPMTARAAYDECWWEELKREHTDTDGRVEFRVCSGVPFEIGADETDRNAPNDTDPNNVEDADANGIPVAALEPGEVREVVVRLTTANDIHYVARVVDRDTGSPIVGARVTVFEEGSSSKSEGWWYVRTEHLVTALTTGEDGSFACDVASWRRLHARVLLDGYNPEILYFPKQQDDTGRENVISLTRRARLTVHLVEPDGKGREGISVRLHAREHTPDGLPIAGAELEWSAMSDASGNAAFADMVSVENVTIHLGPNDHAIRRDPTVIRLEPGEHREITYQLGNGVALRGLLVDQDRKPVPHARVWLEDGSWQRPSYFNPGRTWHVIETTTDDAGRFVFADVLPGDWRVGPAVVRGDHDPPRPDLLAPVAVPVRLEAGHDREIEVRGNRGGYVSGRVISGGKPVRYGALVQGGSRAIAGAVSTDADSEGYFVLGPLADGALFIGAQGHWLESEPREVHPGDAGLVLELVDK